MDVLNADYRRANTDAINTPAIWSGLAVDCEIDFCLATVDPNGAPTTGITRTLRLKHHFQLVVIMLNRLHLEVRILGHRMII